MCVCRTFFRPFQFAVLALWVGVIAPSAWAQNEKANWEDLRNGDHSFRALGPDFSIEMPVRPIKDARVLLFNRRFAEQLGLFVPADPKEAEKFLIDLLALEINTGLPYGAASPPGVPTRIATYYYDSPPSKDENFPGASGGSKPLEKQPGEALGDGRVIWLGEFKIRQPDGTLLYLDVTSRGVQVVPPLAWTKHPDGTHQNGIQSFEEGPISYVNSEVNRQNQLDSSVDLVTFITGSRTVTVRVGTFTRFAHFRFHDDSFERMKKLLDYTINRTLGREVNAPVAAGDVETYLNAVAVRLGENAARVHSLRMIHGAPTYGNMGTGGGFLDTTTNVYVPQFDEEWTAGIGESLKTTEFQAENYVKRFWDSYYASGAWDHYIKIGSLDARVLVRDTFNRRLSEIMLLRIGIPESLLSRISERNLQYGIGLRILDLVKMLGTRAGVLQGRVYYAAMLDADAFVSAILQFARWQGLGPDSNSAWERYFRSHIIDEKYAGSVDKLLEFVPGFRRELQFVLDDLGVTAAQIPQRWIQQAARARLPRRPDPAVLQNRLLDRMDRALDEPSWNWTETTRIADEEMAPLLDAWAPNNPSTQLGGGPVVRMGRTPGVDCSRRFHLQLPGGKK